MGGFLCSEGCVAGAVGSASVAGRQVAILGCGSVGSKQVRVLHESGAKVWAYDIKPDRVQKLVDEKVAVAASEEEVMQMEVDVFSPCALGAVINDDSIPRLRCKVIAGAANNQLHEPEHGDQLKSLDILYAPDYVINAGGIINVACELLPGGYNERASLERIRRIPAALNEVFDLAEERELSTARAARLRAEQIIEAGRASQPG